MMTRITGRIGRQTINTLDHIANQLAFAVDIFKLVFGRPKTGRALFRKFTLEQIYFTGYQALYIVIPVALIIGSTNIVMFSKLPGQYDLGKTMVMLLVREFGPLVTALVVILRTATAVSIEIGYMKVLNEIETVEMAGLDPLIIICRPRLVGITTAILCLFVVFNLVSIIGGFALVWTLTYIPMGNLFGQIGNAIMFADVSVGIIKAVCFGITITVICLYHGFGKDMKLTEIPAQTSKVAIESFFYCLLINVVISVLFYM